MAIQTRTAGARQFFSRHGMLSKWHPKYEFRAGQVDMAEAVEAAEESESEDEILEGEDLPDEDEEEGEAEITTKKAKTKTSSKGAGHQGWR